MQKPAVQGGLPGRLRHRAEQTFGPYQIRERSCLHDPTFGEHDDPVGIAKDARMMGDDYPRDGELLQDMYQLGRPLMVQMSHRVI